MEKFFNAQSLAVIGVSLTKINFGRLIILSNLKQDYSGRLYGVSSAEGDISGVKIVSSIDALPEIPDVAVVVTPAQTVPEILEQCGRKGITRVVIESSGFSELSSEGADTTLLAIAEKYGMKIVGPNCLGLINTRSGMMMPFGVFDEKFSSGNVSIFSQSGGIGLYIMGMLQSHHIFCSKFASIGNKLQLDEIDFLRYYISDPETDMIGAYLEGISRGREFFELAMGSEKPVIVLKSNISANSSKIAQSHTAALSAQDSVIDAAFKQAGIVRVIDEEEMIIATKALSLPPLKGKNIISICLSGGHAVMVADAAERLGFNLIELPQAFIDCVNSLSDRRLIKINNPIDLGDIFDFNAYLKVTETAVSLLETDGVMFNHGYIGSGASEKSLQMLASFAELSKKYNKPIFVAWSPSPSEWAKANTGNPYPVFQNPWISSRALAISADYQERKTARRKKEAPENLKFDNEKIKSILDACAAGKRDPLLNEAVSLIEAAGIKTADWKCIAAVGETSGIRLKYPVALKVVSPEASHKTEVGGVILNIAGEEELRNSITGLTEKLKGMNIRGYFIQEMIAGGEEYIVGGMHDTQFGPLAVAGTGGIFVEVFKDRAIRLAPFGKSEAISMLKELRSWPILEGARGKGRLDVNALADLVCRAGALMDNYPVIRELDLNPVRVFQDGNGVIALDARIITT